MDVIRRSVKLDAGLLELVILGNDRLALAQMISGVTTQGEIIHRLAANGVKSGYIEDGIMLLAEGGKVQVPVAASYFRRVPGKSSMPLYDVPLPEKAADWESWEGGPLDRTVKAGEVLVHVEEPPRVFLVPVNGARKEVSRGDQIDANEFVGPGTEVNGDGTKVLAAREGYPQRGLFGQVSILAMETLPAIARSHGKIRKESAVVVRGEIGREASANIFGSLIANDHITGARLEIGGNLNVNGYIRADNKRQANHITAGQSVRAKGISDATIWAGQDVHILETAKDVTIHCLGNAVMKTLDGGEVRVGHRFIAHEVTAGSSIFLGMRHIEIKALKKVQLSMAQLLSRLTDNENAMSNSKQDYERSKERLMLEIERMRNQNLSGALRQKSMQALQRHLEMMSEAITRLKFGLESYEEAYAMVEKDRARISYCENRLDSAVAPEAIITGKIDPGVMIYGPGQMLELPGGLENVRIVPDPLTGLPQVHSL